MSRAPLLIMLLLVTMVEAVAMHIMWERSLHSIPWSLAFSNNGYLAVPCDKGLCVFDVRGNLLKAISVPTEVMGVSFCCDFFVFTTLTGIVKLFKVNYDNTKRLPIHGTFSNIVASKSGLLLTNSDVSFYNYEGKRLWSIPIHCNVGSPSIVNNIAYIPLYNCENNNNYLLIVNVSNGHVITNRTMNEWALSTSACDNMLVIGTSHKIIMYKLNNGMIDAYIWSRDGIASSCKGIECNGALDVTFDSSCSYIFVADYEGKVLHVFDINGNEVFVYPFDAEVLSVASWNNLVAVGLYNNKVYLLRFNALSNDDASKYIEEFKNYFKSCVHVCPRTCLELLTNSSAIAIHVMNNYNYITKLLQMTQELAETDPPLAELYLRMAQQDVRCADRSLKKLEGLLETLLIYKSELMHSVLSGRKGHELCLPNVVEKLLILKNHLSSLLKVLREEIRGLSLSLALK